MELQTRAMAVIIASVWVSERERGAVRLNILWCAPRSRFATWSIPTLTLVSHFSNIPILGFVENINCKENNTELFENKLRRGTQFQN